MGHVQSMSSCWLSGVRRPVCLNAWPSMVPVVPNDQQLPHEPWSLTGVTAPWAVQFTASGNCAAVAVAGT